MVKRFVVRRFMVILIALAVGFNFLLPSVYAARGGGRGDAGSPGPGIEPKGWDEGKKEGWKGTEQPPGLAKQDKGVNKGKDKGKNNKHKGKHKGKKEEKKESPEAKAHEKEKGER